MKSVLILTDKRLLIYAPNTHKTGDRQKDTFPHEYIFPINSISSIHRTGTLIKSIAIDASGSTYNFHITSGKNQYGDKASLKTDEIIQQIGMLVSDLQYKASKVPLVDTGINNSLYCRHCGKRIKNDSVYCKYCGQKQS